MGFHESNAKGRAWSDAAQAAQAGSTQQESKVKEKEMKWIDFVINVQKWARERGIYEHSTALMQTYKGISEYGELVDAIAKGDKEAIKDGIGDVCVCCVNAAAIIGVALKDPEKLPWDLGTDKYILLMGDELLYAARKIQEEEPWSAIRGLEVAANYALEIAADNRMVFEDCLQVAWDAIKGRQGKMVSGGVF